MNNPNYPNQGRSRVNQASVPVYRYTQQFMQEGSRLRQATWGPRFVATLIDFVLVGVPFNLLGNLIWLQRTFTDSNAPTDSTSSEILTIGLPVEWHNLLWAVVFGLYVWFCSNLLGATLGNRWMNLKIISEDGSPLPRLKSFARGALVGYGLISLGVVGWSILLPLKFDLLLGLNLLFLPGFVLGVGFLWVLFDPQRQGLHDKIVKSYVVIADLNRI
jgi:uncharacterized RDD family membrane protein YckC